VPALRFKREMCPTWCLMAKGALGVVSGIQLSDSNPDGDPVLSRKEDFVSNFPVSVVGNEIRCDIAPYSVVFLSLQVPQGRAK